jgi:hypothetical protein
MRVSCAITPLLKERGILTGDRVRFAEALDGDTGNFHSALLEYPPCVCAGQFFILLMMFPLSLSLFPSPSLSLSIVMIQA